MGHTNLWLNCMCIYNHTFYIWQLCVMLCQKKMQSLRGVTSSPRLENENIGKEMYGHYLQSSHIKTSFFTELGNTRTVVMAKHAVGQNCISNIGVSHKIYL